MRTLLGTYSVLNPDCVNNPPASFELPDPCVDATGATTCPSTFSYSVWARAVTPKGQALMQTCYTDTTTGLTYCNTDLVITLKKSQNFTNVSTSLLQVCLSTGVEAPIFGSNLFNYFWSYDNQGLRMAQLRFYPLPTGTTIGTSCTATPA
jgi:hypothetical protein